MPSSLRQRRDRSGKEARRRVLELASEISQRGRKNIAVCAFVFIYLIGGGRTGGGARHLLGYYSHGRPTDGLDGWMDGLIDRRSELFLWFCYVPPLRGSIYQYSSSTPNSKMLKDKNGDIR